MVTTSYIIEYAKSGRSKCSAGKRCSDTIEKGEMRVGVHFDQGGRDMTKYRHWRCTTETLLENIGSLDQLNGYRELNEVDQKAVEQAFDRGHVGEEKENPTASEENGKVTEKTSKTKAKAGQESKDDKSQDQQETKKSKADAVPAKKTTTNKRKSESINEEKVDDDNTSTATEVSNGTKGKKDAENAKKTDANQSKQAKDNKKSKVVKDKAADKDKDKTTSKKTPTSPQRRSTRLAK